MDAQSVLRERRTIHKYLPEPVPEDVVQRALEAAHLAPNHKLTFPWRFTVVGPETRARIAELAVRLKKPEAPAQEDAVRGKILNPGLMIIVSQQKTDDTFRSKEDYAAVSCAIQNLMLSLWSDGFGSKWSTGGITRENETVQIAQIPETEEVVGFIWGGVPAQESPTPKRPPLDEVVRRLP